jgi:DNA (cytosine-5)-methyltransferase 1
MDERLGVVSLFSGVGGFELGLERAGMRSVYQCEIDKNCRGVLERHWPGLPRWDDVQTLTGREIISRVDRADVVAWGSPCQDLSFAGKRAGLSGERSSLFHEGMRVIREMREETNGEYPRISIWENVAGALSSNKGADFGAVLDSMAEAGAVVIEWRLLDAQFFGVPQRRRRVFVVALFDPAAAAGCADSLLSLSEGLRGHPPEGRSQRQGSPGETAPSPRGRDEAEPPEIVQNYARPTGEAVLGSEIVANLNASDHKWPQNQQLDENKFVVFENSYRDAARIADRVTNTLSAKMGTGGNNTPIVAYALQGSMIGRQDHNGPRGRGHGGDGDPMFTLTSTDVHAVAFLPGAMVRQGLQPYEEFAPPLRAEDHNGDNATHVQQAGLMVRRLMPIECERLMGWPDEWTRWRADGKEQADTVRYKQCGNGVASPVAEWIGGILVRLLGGARE